MANKFLTSNSGTSNEIFKDISATRQKLGLIPGQTVQSHNTKLDAISGLSLSSGKILKASGSNTFSLLNISSHGETALNSSEALINSAALPTNNNTLTNGAGYITASSTDTLTNKTITSPVISEITNGSETITLPSSSGTLALFNEIPTNNQHISNGAGYITSAALPTNNNTLTNGAGYITATSTNTLTNKNITYTHNTNLVFTGDGTNGTGNGTKVFLKDSSGVFKIGTIDTSDGEWTRLQISPTGNIGLANITAAGWLNPTMGYKIPCGSNTNDRNFLIKNGSLDNDYGEMKIFVSTANNNDGTVEKIVIPEADNIWMDGLKSQTNRYITASGMGGFHPNIIIERGSNQTYKTRWYLGVDNEDGSSDGDFCFGRQYATSSNTWSSTIVCNGFLQDAETDTTQMNFTGQHRCRFEGNIDDYKIGMLVVATGKYNTYVSETVKKMIEQVDAVNNVIVDENGEPELYESDEYEYTSKEGKEAITINDALPVVKLSTNKKQKSVFGIVSFIEDTNISSRSYGVGTFKTRVVVENDGPRIFCNGVGEGGIWVSNSNGNLENGDYLQSSDIEGYAEKQNGTFYHNYTCAKITCDCSFDLNSKEYECKLLDNGYKIAFVGCVYLCS